MQLPKRWYCPRAQFPALRPIISSHKKTLRGERKAVIAAVANASDDPDAAAQFVPVSISDLLRGSNKTVPPSSSSSRAEDRLPRTLECSMENVKLVLGRSGVSFERYSVDGSAVLMGVVEAEATRRAIAHDLQQVFRKNAKIDPRDGGPDEGWTCVSIASRYIVHMLSSEMADYYALPELYSSQP